jgi:tRNA threonylcarbamoyladenosine biosynthesis protein TsaE
MPQNPQIANETAQISRSVRKTEALAAQLARTLVGGECIALDGQLGAGKTHFVRGLAKALGIPARAVSSPTYVLLNVYPGGRLPVFHLDAYRTQSSEDFEAIGFTELLDQNGVVIVEWASRIQTLLPRCRINVQINVTAPTIRVITVKHLY